MSQKKLIGQIAYEAYWDYLSTNALHTRKVPRYLDLPLEIQVAWREAAKAVLKNQVEDKIRDI